MKGILHTLGPGPRGSLRFLFSNVALVVAGVSPWFLDQQIWMKFPNRLVDMKEWLVEINLYGHDFRWFSIRYGQLIILNLRTWIVAGFHYQLLSHLGARFLPLVWSGRFSALRKDGKKTWVELVELMTFQQYCVELQFNGFRISALQTCVAKNLFTNNWARSWNSGLEHQKLTDWKHKKTKQSTCHCLNSLNKARFFKIQLQEMYMYRI